MGRIISCLKQLQASSRQVESLTALPGRDREVRSLQSQLEDLSARYTEQANAMKLRDAEMAAMTQDLANMTTENQSVNEVQNLRRSNKALSARLAAWFEHSMQNSFVGDRRRREKM